MARRVTKEDIIKINEAFSKTHSYNKTAEITGWSAATVRKYVNGASFKKPATPPPTIKDFFNPDLIGDFDPSCFEIENWGVLCVIDEQSPEKTEIEQLWEDLRL